MEVESTYASPVGVKLAYGNEMRRFQFSGGSFSAFKAQVVAILGLEQTDVVLKYTDEENDLITLSSDLELRSAIVPNHLLRVSVLPCNQPAATAPAASARDMDEEPIEFFHYPQLPQTTQNVQFYNPSQQQHAGADRWNRKFGGFEEKADKKDKKEKKEKKHDEKRDKCEEKREKMEKKERKEEEKRQRKMVKKWGHHHPHSPHAHHPYMHPHAHQPPHHPHPFGHPHHPPHPHHPRPFEHAHPHGPKHQEKHGKFVARFVTDVDTPDGTIVPAGTPFSKTWRLRNEGAAWPVDCGLTFIGRLSDQLSAPTFMPMGEVVAPHQEVNVVVPMVAPAKPGRYTAYFRMCTADGVKFGQRVWVSIVVPSPSGGVSPSSSSSEGEQEADKYEALVDVVLRNEMFRSIGLKRHWVFRQLQKHDGDVDKVVAIMTKKVEKKMLKQSKKH